MFKSIKNLFRKPVLHIPSHPSGDPTPFSVICKNCGDWRYADIMEGHEPSSLAGMIKIAFEKDKDARMKEFIAMVHQDPILMALVRSLNTEASRLTTEEKEAATDLGALLMKERLRKDEENKFSTKLQKASYVVGALEELQNKYGFTDEEKDRLRRLIEGNQAIQTVAKAYSDLKPQEHVTDPYDHDGQAGSRALKPGMFPRPPDEQYSQGPVLNQEELIIAAKKIEDGLKSQYHITEEDIKHFHELFAGGYTIVKINVEDADRLHEEDFFDTEESIGPKENLFDLGAKLMQEKLKVNPPKKRVITPADIERLQRISQDSHSEPANPSPVLNKEQLEKLADQSEAARLHRQEEALEKAKLEFSLSSLSKLPWISIKDRLPSFTKEDYLCQDTLCILQVQYSNVISIEFGLYCPVLKLFRDYSYDFDDDNESYDNLPFDEEAYRFYIPGHYKKVTHWMPLSRQLIPKDGWINFDLPIRDIIGNIENGPIELKRMSEITLEDLPWIPVSERMPKYTFEQFRNGLTKCLMKNDRDIDTVYFAPNANLFYPESDDEGYPIDNITHWFPISPEEE